MTSVEKTTSYVIGQDEMVWQKQEYGQTDFYLSQPVINADYTSVFTAQVCKIGPGGGSPPHTHTYNHAFYVASGTGTVRIEEQDFPMWPGTVVKVPEGKLHSVANSGAEDLIFITIYDPSNIDGTP